MLDFAGLEPDLMQISECLLAQGALLATAESCTGGLVAAACTERSGSSQWFDRGFVTYSNAAKSEISFLVSACIKFIGSRLTTWVRVPADASVHS